MKEDFTPVDVGILVLEAVGELHRRGHELVRILPGMSGSGMYWRVSVTLANNLDDQPYYEVGKRGPVAHYTTGSELKLYGTAVDGSTRIQDVADLLLAELGDRGRGADPAYVGWYAELLGRVLDRRWLPIAYADYFDVSKGWEVGWGSGVRVAHPPPYVAVDDDEQVTERLTEISSGLPPKIVYSELKGKQQEIYNFQKVAALLAEHGFNCIKLDDDWNGADFLAYHKDGEHTLKVQLKSVLTIDKKYLDKGLHITFPVHGVWHVLEHDLLVDLCGQHTPWLDSNQWKSGKPYWSAKPSVALRAAIAPFALGEGA